MDSLYGGQPGVSFVLKGTFESVEKMTQAFSKGPNYRDVWYGEYCLIDTRNKNHKDNGKIYRRGYNYLETPMHGAEFFGSVVGPSGGNPYFQMNSLEPVKEKSKIPLGEYEYRRYPTGKDANGNYITTDSTGEIGTFNFSANGADKALVPGKTINSSGQTVYNDDILYTWVNIRKDNNTSDSWFYVGFQIPYLVNDFSVHMVSAYDANGNRTDRLADMVRVPVIGANGKEENHPYYQHWDFGIPKGVRGDCLRNLKVITPQAGDRIFSLDTITWNSTTEDFNLPVLSGSNATPNYTGFDEDVAGKRQILVYDYYFYNNKRDGEWRRIYLGDYNLIKNVSLDINTGTFTIQYTHANNYTARLSWLKNVDLAADGTLNYEFTNPANNKADDTKIQWVNDVLIRKDAAATKAYLDFIYNTRAANGSNNKKSLEVDWIQQVSVNTSNGNLSFAHLNGTVDTFAGVLGIIKSAQMSADGQLTFSMNNGTNFVVKDGNTDNNYHFKQVNNVSLGSGIKDDKHIKITYNYNGGANTTVSIGNSINYIEKVYVRPSDYHMFVLYGDPAHRGTSAGTDSNGRKWVALTASDTGAAPYNTPDIFWQDLGAMKDQAGVMVGKNITSADLGGKTVIDYLNSTYPSGLTGSLSADGQSIDPLNGKVITYGETAQKTEKEFYAFDYDKRTWYYLGQIALSNKVDAKIVDGALTADKIQDINNGGVIIQTNTYNITAANVKSHLPQTWLHNWQG